MSKTTHMMTNLLMTFESYSSQIMDFDLLGPQPNLGYLLDKSAKILRKKFKGNSTTFDDELFSTDLVHVIF